jgi:hypothetical protein
MILNKDYATAVVAEWIDDIRRMPRSGVVDYSTILPWRVFSDGCRESGRYQQDVTGLFVRTRYNSKGEVSSAIDWPTILDTAETYIDRTWERKAVSGLVRHKGWRFSQRYVATGVEIRPGMAFIVATRAAMPTCRVVARITRQGSANEFDKVEVYDKEWKGIKAI